MLWPPWATEPGLRLNTPYATATHSLPWTSIREPGASSRAKRAKGGCADCVL